MSSCYLLDFENYLHLARVSDKTREAYLRSLRDLEAYCGQAAPTLTDAQVNSFFLHSIQERKLSWSSCNVLFCGVKKFYHGYLGRSTAELSIPPRPRAKQLPMLLSQEEVHRILQAAGNIKHQALLATVYGSGLRVSEVVQLRPEHIDGARGLIRVEQGKGRKDRYTILSQKGLDLLRQHWRTSRPQSWIFFGRDKACPMSINTAQRIYYTAKEKTGISKGRGIHTLRHCFATHSLDAGTEIYVIKRWMGHSSLKTTYRYIHITPGYLRRVVSPLDLPDVRGEQ